jgi:hypothetical protein
MDSIDWLEPWGPLCTAPNSLENELYCEVSVNHILFERKVSAIGRRYDCDDILFRVFDSEFNYAVVHLTYSKKKEICHLYPITIVYKDLMTWINECMNPSNVDYNL